MKNLYLIVLITILTFPSCSTRREVVMPFRNFLYSGERLFPIEKNDSERAFRAWINNGTSVDRVVSVSRDSSFNDQAYLFEFGFLDKKQFFKTKSESFYKDIQIKPNSGFNSFFEKIDSLDLINYTNQDSFNIAIDHQPFSIYVIEVKVNNKYNQFSFRTHFPNNRMKDGNKYEEIERLLFQEFKYNFYMK